MFRYNFTPTDEEKTSVLEMFSNNLTIPKNFVSLENYKSKTNPQTTQFCDKLCVDDPLALLLGKWTRSSLSNNDPEADNTFSSFVNSTVCSNNEDDFIDHNSEKLPSFVLPEPKNDTTYTDLDKSTLFDITSSSIPDTSSEEPKSEETNEEMHQLEGNLLKFSSYSKFFLLYFTFLML